MHKVSVVQLCVVDNNRLQLKMSYLYRLVDFAPQQTDKSHHDESDRRHKSTVSKTQQLTRRWRVSGRTKTERTLWCKPGQRKVWVDYEFHMGIFTNAPPKVVYSMPGTAPLWFSWTGLGQEPAEIPTTGTHEDITTDSAQFSACAQNMMQYWVVPRPSAGETSKNSERKVDLDVIK